jgi:integrase/recombinase XerD
MLAVPLNEEKRLYLDILHSTGARPGEGVSIRKSDVILEEPYGIVLWTKKKRGGTLTPRRMGISDDLALRLERWIKDHPDQTYLFQQEGNKSKMNHEKPRHYRWICNLQKEVCKESKVKHFTPHSYRHFFASKLCQEGYALIKIQYFLGHEDAKTTENYIHDLMGAPAIPKEVLA